VSRNRIEIDGKVTRGDSLRHTPAGIPVLRFRLAHASPQREAGRERAVSYEIDVLAFGDIAARIAACAPESTLRCVGFLDRASARDSSPSLHVTEFEIIKE
jgi:primosomal replication protein N